MMGIPFWICVISLIIGGTGLGFYICWNWWVIPRNQKIEKLDFDRRMGNNYARTHSH